jgi:thiamine-monophosphate kinase
MPGEFEFIDWIRSQQQHLRSGARELVQLAAGDDLAVLKWPADDLIIVGVDQVLDGIHFDAALHSPRAIGRKVMNRNLSDCAAMACLPAAAVATVALPHGTSLDYAKELYFGIKEAADAFDCAIVGGDTASWPGKLVVTVTILGRSAGVTPITRAGAKPGQHIYVTGPLGGSILGRHMDFVPRVHEARQLAATGLVSAMIDISDGLSRDLGHICEQSSVGAVVLAGKVPVHADVARLPHDDRSLLEHALHDGEDHELLLTTTDALPESFGAIRIGYTTLEKGTRLRTDGGDIPLEPQGWEHKL